METILKRNYSIISTKYTFKWKSLNFMYTLIKDDLTTQDVEIIVNAANNELWLGGGVAGAIRNKGGYEIQKECKEAVVANGNKSFNNGDVVPTGVGNFSKTNPNLKFIFHAVGPIYYDGERNEKEDLFKTFKNCFNLSENKGIKSLALPPISSGIFGYPKDECARVFYESMKEYVLERKENNEKTFTLEEVKMTIIDNETYGVFEKIHNEIIKDFIELFKDDLEYTPRPTDDGPKEYKNEEVNKI